jgi:hypothetical protein
VDDYAASGTHMYGWPADTRYPQESSRGADVLAAQDMLPLIVAIRDGVLVAIEALPEDKNRKLSDLLDSTG